MRRRCPHCREPTIGLGALWRSEFRHQPVVCTNCGKNVRSGHLGSWLQPVADIPAMLLADGLLIFLVALTASAYFGTIGASAAVLATIAFSVALLTLTPLVLPLQIVSLEPEERLAPKYPRIAFVRTRFLSLVLIGVIVLAGVFIVRIIAAFF